MSPIADLHHELTSRTTQVLDTFARPLTDDERAGAQEALADKRAKDVMSCGAYPLTRRAQRAWADGHRGKAMKLYAASGPLFALRSPLYMGSLVATPAAYLGKNTWYKGLDKPRSDDGVRACVLGHQLDGVLTQLHLARCHLKYGQPSAADIDDARALMADARTLLKRFDVALEQANVRLRASTDVLAQRTRVQRLADRLEQTLERVSTELAQEARATPHRPSGSDFAAG